MHPKQITVGKYFWFQYQMELFTFLIERWKSTRAAAHIFFSFRMRFSTFGVNDQTRFFGWINKSKIEEKVSVFVRWDGMLS